MVCAVHEMVVPECSQMEIPLHRSPPDQTLPQHANGDINDPKLHFIKIGRIALS